MTAAGGLWLAAGACTFSLSEHPAEQQEGHGVRMEPRDGGAAQRPRLASIDVLRGVAILWVILFHLWGDIKFFPPVPHDYYQRFADRVAGGSVWPAFTSFTDIFFRDGFEGVPLFMMLSGLSLTLVAYRGQAPQDWTRFFVHRFRKLMVPYWTGVAITYAVIVAIALRQAGIGDGAFGSQIQHGITISLRTHVLIDRDTVLASMFLLPRLLHDDLFFAPQLALWFVGLLAQYYLMFPLLFVLMRRIGLIPFLAVTLAFTVLANCWVLYQYRYLELQFRLVTGWAPFRLFEFTSGMAIGAILADPARQALLDRLRRGPMIAAALVLGVTAHTAGDLLIGQWDTGYWQALALPLVTLGLACIAVPVVTKRPSRADGWLPLRALAAAGVMSYTVLIINDPMRLIASQIRLEHAPAAVWWGFLVAVYVPVTMMLAWPLARVLGLLPDRPRAKAPASQRSAHTEESFAGAPAG